MKKKIQSILHSVELRRASTFAVLAAAMMCFASAEGPSSAATITSALTTATTSMISDSMTMIGTLVPVVLPLLGASILVAYGIKFIKRIVGKA